MDKSQKWETVGSRRGGSSGKGISSSVSSGHIADRGKSKFQLVTTSVTLDANYILSYGAQYLHSPLLSVWREDRGRNGEAACHKCWW